MQEQYFYIDEDGDKFYYKDKAMTILHREDGPAFESVSANGCKLWYLNDKSHREDGPAVEYADGSNAWFINGKYHREDRPAVEYANGTKYWYINGQRHHEDGPAIEYANGSKAWFLNDLPLTEKQFNERTNSVVEL